MTLLPGLLAAAALCAADVEWPQYGRDAGGSRYSPLKQITVANVSRLRVAWEYHTGALEPATALNEKAAFEATPILVDGTLYLSTPFDQVIALDPVSGREKWKFDPHVDRSGNYSEVTSRGVSTWVDAQGHRRIFIATIDARLIAIDAGTGKRCDGFADVDLTEGVNLVPSSSTRNYEVTSPPAVVNDLVICGSSVGDNRRAVLERGTVRAFEARTGKLRWSWDPLPPGGQTGAANAWGAIASDPARDLVFIPTGSASPDYYGGLRPGDNRHANSVVALRASTGKMVWAFQVVHHDLWDYDVASEPSLFTFTRRGKKIPAIAVTTKIGHLFVLNRETGEPLIPVEERAVPQSGIPGERTSPTQPFPKSDPMVPQGLTAKDAWGATPADRNACRAMMEKLDSRGLFTPPSIQGSIAFPGNVGGVNWGSSAVDTDRGWLYAATNRWAAMARLIPRDKYGDEVKRAKDNRMSGEFGPQAGAPYGMYRELLAASARGAPCNAPPWGTLVAMDLSDGSKKWDVPLGLSPWTDSAGKRIPGSVTLGGPMVTAGGLVFASAAIWDEKLQAFDAATGRELWSAQLPASSQATPMTYSIRGKQYVVICAGGHGKAKNKMGDSVVAFTLP